MGALTSGVGENGYASIALGRQPSGAPYPNSGTQVMLSTCFELHSRQSARYFQVFYNLRDEVLRFRAACEASHDGEQEV